MREGASLTRILASMDTVPLLETVSLDPSPTIDAYKSGIDRTILRENLKLTPHERVERMIAALRFAEAVRRSKTDPDR